MTGGSTVDSRLIYGQYYYRYVLDGQVGQSNISSRTTFFTAFSVQKGLLFFIGSFHPNRGVLFRFCSIKLGKPFCESTAVDISRGHIRGGPLRHKYIRTEVYAIGTEAAASQGHVLLSPRTSSRTTETRHTYCLVETCIALIKILHHTCCARTESESVREPSTTADVLPTWRVDFLRIAT